MEFFRVLEFKKIALLNTLGCSKRAIKMVLGLLRGVIPIEGSSGTTNPIFLGSNIQKTEISTKVVFTKENGKEQVSFRHQMVLGI